MNLKIRNAEYRDLDSLAALLRQLFSIETEYTVNGQRQRRGLALMLDGCGKHRCVKVAERDGRVVGMCTAQLLVSTAEGACSALIEDLVVNEPLRGKGIGTALLETIEKWARQHGATRLQLLADGENLRALAFYRKRSWLPTRMICLRRAAGKDA